MKGLILTASLLIASPVWAFYCNCEVYAVSPLTSSEKSETHTIAEVKGRFYGLSDITAVRECRQDCALNAQADFDEDTLKTKLTPWVDELVDYKLAGFNCTGPTSFKVPVRVRAKLGERTLGIAREQIIFIHRNRSCFI